MWLDIPWYQKSCRLVPELVLLVVVVPAIPTARR